MAKYNVGDVLVSHINPHYVYKVVEVKRGGHMVVLPIDKKTRKELYDVKHNVRVSDFKGKEANNET